MKILVFLTILLAILFISPGRYVHGQPTVTTNWYVATFGSEENDCLSPQTPCELVSTVMNSPKFQPEDIIYVERGNYYNPTQTEESLLIDQSLIISGGWNPQYTEQDGFSYFYGEQQIGITVVKGVDVEFYNIASSGGDYYRPSRLQTTLWTKGGLRNFGALKYHNSGASGFFGYGIYNGGTLTMTDSSVRVTYGTAIINNGTLYGEQIEVKDSTTEVGCVGIENQGDMWLRFSIIKNNRSHYGNGGICNYGTMTIVNSAISANFSTDTDETAVGGIANFGALSLISTAVYNNYGYYTTDLYNTGSLFLANATIKSDSVIEKVIVNTSDGTIESRNSIVSRCQGMIQSDGYNLLADSEGCDWQAATGDILDRDPLLDATLTPRIGSPTINAGNPAGCLAWDDIPLKTDGRGNPRWQICDTGAYEYIPPAGEIFTQRLPLMYRASE